MNWKIKNISEILKTFPFNVEKIDLEKNGKELDHPYFRINTSDWVNVLPIDSNGNAILIKQYRSGSNSVVLEVPAGKVDPGEENDTSITALRELEEETGYTSSNILSMGSVNPNPAIQTNRVHFFLAFDCVKAVDRKHFPDQEEDIEVVLTKTSELDSLVRSGKMDHCLSAHCILLSGKYIDIGAQKTPSKLDT